VSSFPKKDYISIDFEMNQMFKAKSDNVTLEKGFRIPSIEVPTQVPSEQQYDIMKRIGNSA